MNRFPTRCLACAVATILLAALPARADAKAVIQGDSIDDTPAPAAPAAPTPVAVAAPVPAPVKLATTNAVPAITSVGGIVTADFATLASYTFNVPDMTAPNHPTIAQAEKQIPAPIKGLDGKTVRIRGFMMPVKELQGKTTEFLITRGQPSCCFSGATEINEFVTVKVPGKGFETMMDDPITIEGKLHVGALTDSGFIVGVYQLDGEKLIPPAK